jgi:hypothetical protein
LFQFENYSNLKLFKLEKISKSKNYSDFKNQQPKKKHRKTAQNRTKKYLNISRPEPSRRTPKPEKKLTKC